MPTYLDNAATSHPKPAAVYSAADEFLRHGAGNPGRGSHRRATEAAGLVARCRMRLARLLGVPVPARVVFTPGCTHALNLALKGLLRPGDRVATTSLEHNAVARPLRSLERRGVIVDRAPCPEGQFDWSAFRARLTPETRLAVVVHASNVTGEVLPVAEIATACAALGVPLLVDAAQTAGALPTPARDWGQVLVALAGHKGLLGPTGVGALYVAEGLEPQPLVEGGTGTRSESDEQPETLPDRFESGTLNGPGLAGLEAALAWLEERGVATVRKSELALTEHLARELAAIPGVRVYGPPAGADRAAVVSFTLADWDPQDLAPVLDERFDVQCRAGLHCAPWAHQSLGTFPGGTVRFSPGPFTTEAEVETAVSAVRQVAGA
jgi:cysteine desulfurase/selenocysteine lyase